MTERLQGKNVLIAGCDSSHARTVALQLAAAGASVALQFKSQKEQVLEQVETINAIGGSAVAFCAPLENYEAADQLTRCVLKWCGKIDVLIHHARTPATISFREMNADQWHLALVENLYSAFHLSKCVSRQMAESGGGVILNITASDPFSGVDGGVDFSASEGGVHGMTLAMAKELASKHIRVNAIAPNADLFKHSGAIGNLAIFLVSPESAAISGEIFKLDGILYEKEGD